MRMSAANPRPPVTVARGCYTASFSSFAGRNAIFLLALILMASPVAGVRPILAARFRTRRTPRPVSRFCRPSSEAALSASPSRPARPQPVSSVGHDCRTRSGQMLERDGGLYRSFGRGGGLLSGGGSLLCRWHDGLPGFAGQPARPDRIRAIPERRRLTAPREFSLGRPARQWH
jgi:hypothetical protein